MAVRCPKYSRRWKKEGWSSAEQERNIIRELRMLGLTPTFVRAVDDFVSAKPIDDFSPTNAEAEQIRQYIESRDQVDPTHSTTG